MKNILVALSGLSPQVITETVFALYCENKTIIDEIIILTTIEGKNRINRNIFVNKNKGKSEYDLKTELGRLSNIHKIPIPALVNNKITVLTAEDEASELSDVSTSNQAKAFPELIIRVLKKQTANEFNIVHCSLSGGRKTMSFYMGMALSFFGRADDKLWHVVASKEFESSGEYFPGKNSPDDVLTLSEIPYVHLRPILAQLVNNQMNEEFSFRDIVEHTQRLLKLYNSPKLKINLNASYISFGHNAPVRISQTELLMYRFILDMKKQGKFAFIDEISFKLWNDTTNLTLYQKRLLSYIRKLNDKISKAVNDIDYFGKYKIMGPTELKEGKGLYGVMAGPDEIEYIQKP